MGFCYVIFLPNLVLRLEPDKSSDNKAKINIKSEKITHFGGLFHVREQFSRYVGSVIKKVLGALQEIRISVQRDCWLAAVIF